MKRRMGPIARFVVTVSGALFAAVVLVSQTMAVPRYNDFCNSCHGAFTDGTSPKGTIFPQNDKHRMHNGPLWMNTDCDLCHSAGDENNPFIGFSNGTSNNPGVGCTGCHGRDYGGTIGDSGVGLRVIHVRNGIAECGFCHFDDPPPLPEHILPTYYGTADTNVDQACNESGLENWSIGDAIGLDNDGDGFFDANDGDCGLDGDMNCDNLLDTNDIGAFISALMDPAAYQIGYPDCDLLKADFNESGDVNGLDAAGFVAALIG